MFLNHKYIMNFVYILIFLEFIGLYAQQTDCPCYGCNSAGTFSVPLQLSSSEYKLIWNTTYGPVWNSPGCVGNYKNIMCPYQGLRLRGYVSIDINTGNQKWYDGMLRYPSLPVIDKDGGFVGTDGSKVVRYSADGTLIHLVSLAPDLYPVYSTLQLENGLYVFASKNGKLFTVDKGGMLYSIMNLSGTVNGTQGTFSPITTPVAIFNRIYVLTVFKPDGIISRQPHKRLITNCQRLFAIDVMLTEPIAKRLSIAWHHDFMSEHNQRRYGLTDVSTKAFGSSSEPLHKHEQLLMTDTARCTVYIILKTQDTVSNNVTKFIAVKDMKNYSSISFTLTTNISAMAMYNNCYNTSTCTHNEESSSLWLLDDNRNILLKVDPNTGSVEASIELSDVLNAKTEVTSDLMIVQNGTSIVCGVKVNDGNTIRNYVLILNEAAKLERLIATPQNVTAIGQIVGISSGENILLDTIVVFGFDSTISESIVFGIR